MIGRVLSRYKILEEVGQGGMAVVYRGLDTSLGREVAVKVLHPHLAGHAESRARLQREAQAVAKLRHENILEIFDYSGADSPDSFIVTEFIHGPTLTAFVREHPIPLPEVAAMIAAEITRGLEHAHSLGVIHRDVKPENVMLRGDGRLVITDFGIAQMVDKERMTVTGQLLGSPAYMSPEHVEGGRIDLRTDVFACGILTYQLATGALPFRGKNPHEMLKRIADCHFTPPDQVNPLVSPGLSRIICRALARAPDDRYPDLGAMRRELLAELATVGITDPREELRGFFSQPESWRDEFQPRLVQALAEAGRRASARGRPAAALSAWSRALTIDPANPEVRGLVERLGRRRRLLRVVAGCGVGTFVLGLSVLGARWFAPLHLGPDMGSHAFGLGGDPVTAATPGPGPSGPSTAPTLRARTEIRRPPLLRPPAVATREVKFTVYPTTARIFVDETERRDFETGRPIRIPQATRTIRFANPDCCSDVVRPLGDGEVDLGEVRLPWKSGKVIVKTTPEDADVAWRTPTRSGVVKGGEAITVTFPQGGLGSQRVQVTVRGKGYLTKEKSCLAFAGRDAECSLELDRIPALP